MQQFRKSDVILSDPADRSREDLIRFYYVAYSRAQYILFILLKSNEISPGEEAGQQLGLGGGKLSWLKDHVDVLEV
jgi:ATP-dependent exoDNAse (exonuclease V) beta subunit